MRARTSRCAAVPLSRSVVTGACGGVPLPHRATSAHSHSLRPRLAAACRLRGSARAARGDPLRIAGDRLDDDIPAHPMLAPGAQIELSDLTMSSRVRFALVALLLLAVAGCGDDDDAPDADAARTVDAAATGDAPNPADANPHAPDAQLGADAAGDAPDATSAADLGPVDCRTDDDCPGSINTCALSAPGGICSGGCSDNADCPALTTCDTGIGACIRDCSDDADCSLGKRCLTGSGRCALRSCSDASPCPAPYTCDTGFCRRPMCGDGDSCPAPLICGGTYCVEP